jgi:hypothetical protein
MRFNGLLNKLLEEYNAQPIEGIDYQQYSIVEKKGFYYIFNEDRRKIIGSGKTIKEVRELIDTIVSGC